tara:strand:- start:358 stop:1485 length:1128 start_codon:yes stop_codon:yes gene_type:complete
MKKKIQFNIPHLTKNSKIFIKKVFERKNFTDGYFQKKCEKFIKNKTKTKFVSLTHSGTSALEIAMILLNIGKGDEVLLPSYTFTSTANSVIMSGAKPVFVDIDKNLNIDPEKLEKKISKKTKGIIIVHYGGFPCDMDKILKLKKKYNLFLIEDAAHAFLAKYKKKYIGTLGEIGMFSFHETKNFISGQGGALLINNNKYVNKAKIILDKGTDRSFYLNKKKYYSWKGFGSEYRAPELSAALLFSQFEDYKNIQKKREKIWKFYYNKLSKFSPNKFETLNYKNKLKVCSYHSFPIIFKSIKIRNYFIKFMKMKGIYCYFHYFPLHMSDFGKKFTKEKLLNTEKAWNGLVRLPIYPDLKISDLKHIAKSIEIFARFL